MISLPARWRAALCVYAHRRIVVMLLLGFAAGLPLLLVFDSLAVWSRKAGVEVTSIGFLSWAGAAYGIKFLWSPLVDRAPVPLLTRWLGRRRGWLLLTQGAVIACLLAMAGGDPAVDLMRMAFLATLLAFSSATQDIVIDAWRIEAAAHREQAAMAAAYITGYRLAMVTAGAGVFEIAALAGADGDVYSPAGWRIAWLVMAVAMCAGPVATFLAKEPDIPAGVAHPPRGDLSGSPSRLLGHIRGALLSPFMDFFHRYARVALLILALVVTYRICDMLLGVMAGSFYVDMGFEIQEIGRVSKVFGVLMTLTGAFLGGALTVRFGVFRVLVLGALLAAATNMLFAVMALQEKNLALLALVVAADNLSGGVATVAFVAWLSGLTGAAHRATQYALLSSLMTFVPKLAGGFSGMAVAAWGYPVFFTATTLAGVPALLLIFLIRRYGPQVFGDRPAAGQG